MKIITKYIGTTIITYILLVMLFLFGLHMFIEFIREFPSIGEGSYGLYKALIYVLLMLPYDIYQFFPMASLLGSVIALGLLASHSELIIMRAAGMSLVNIASAVVKAAMVFLVLMILVGEVLSPIALRSAARIKTKAISSGQVLLTKQGVWLYNNHNFININSVSNDGKLQGITRYQFGDGLKLQMASHAESAVYTGGQWVFSNVIQTEFNDTVVTSSSFSEQQWPFAFSPKLIGVTHVDTDHKNLFELRSYIKHRVVSGLDVANYKFEFWRRVFAPLATLIMILLAIPFIFGPLRSTSMGLRMLVGIMAGFGFYMLHQFAGPMSIVYQVPPVLAAILPSLIFAVIGVGVMFKTH
ncbi:MAG: hypothetical protein ACD_69C00091G0002 [uncultured bacterium]|nr:MAG: hypothetical protein ACD_69C00091G0002 [uncultured bacterium]